MSELQALCMKCRNAENKPTMQVMKPESIQVFEKNNRYSAKGTCSSCGGNMFKFMNKETAESLGKEIQKAK
jgi:predicted nucleic-acid-binding Zn-ribbon protein